MTSKLQEFMSKQAELEALQKSIEDLKQNPEFENEINFRDQLEGLMHSYDMTAADVIRMIDPQGDVRPTETKRTIKPRATKVYRHPDTGEVVESKGGNNKTIKAWKDEFGRDTVEGWIQQVIEPAA